MISVVVYGRNDNYGYNLHKRAAISLNCISEVLTSANDEILFVDYNTPNDLPTFPEAIQDTLTDRAKKIIRVIRVRPHIHDRIRHRTRLLAIEPLSRNIGLRRANSGNQWFLSTNTDIVFIPQHKNTLTEVVSGLKPGLYHAPRLEIPETLWEGLDRTSPKSIIPTVKQWGKSLHLDEIVTCNDPIVYDGPGDFQLMDRDSFGAIDGFDEEMTLGWHVDSNICVRMNLYHGWVGDLGQEVYAYHCDHTRQITPAHRHDRQQNDMHKFVIDVKKPNLPDQRKIWGLPDEYFEEIRLTASPFRGYVSSITAAFGNRAVAAGEVAKKSERVHEYPYALPFLLDILSVAPKDLRVTWYGLRRENLEKFSDALAALGFTNPPIVDSLTVREGGLATAKGALSLPQEEALSQADAFIFDATPPESIGEGTDNQGNAARKVFVDAFARAAEFERRRMQGTGSAPRRFAAVNTSGDAFEEVFRAQVDSDAVRLPCGLRHGFVFPAGQPTERTIA